MQFEYDPERLIDEIKLRPGIWDFEDVEYRNKHVRHKLWTEVVKELMDSEVKVSKSEMRELEIQLQKKWKSIRDCFHKYVQNPNRTRKPYIYNKQLQFLLKNHLAEPPENRSSDSEDATKPIKVWKSKRTLNLRKEDESSEEDNNEPSENESRDFLSDEAVTETSRKKRRKGSKPQQTTDEFMFASVDAPLKSENDDPDRMFLLSLLPHLKSIPDEMRINVKMDLMQVLSNANFNNAGRDQKFGLA